MDIKQLCYVHTLFLGPLICLLWTVDALLKTCTVIACRRNTQSWNEILLLLYKRWPFKQSSNKSSHEFLNFLLLSPSLPRSLPSSNHISLISYHHQSNLKQTDRSDWTIKYKYRYIVYLKLNDWPKISCICFRVQTVWVSSSQWLGKMLCANRYFTVGSISNINK